MKYFEEGEQTGIKRTPEQAMSVKISCEKNPNKASPMIHLKLFSESVYGIVICSMVV